MIAHDTPIYDDTVTADTYIEIGGQDAIIQGVMCEWTNSAANVSFSIESTIKSKRLAASDSTSLQDWVPEPSITFTGAAPAGSATGAQIAHISHSGARRLRLKVTHVADADLRVYIHGKKGGK
jgi:hypothetical protein